MKLGLLAVVLLIGCHSELPWSPPPVADDGCEQAGARLAALQCPDATGPDGTPYAVVCRDAAAGGVRMKGAQHVPCLQAAKDCTEAEKCL